MSSIDARKNRRSSARKASAKGRFRRSGTATLELALTLSILFSICYGLIEYGYYFYVKNTMDGAAREGCRAGIVTGATLSASNTAIENQLQAANLVPSGTGASGSGPCTIGNYTVNYTDETSGATITSSTLSSMTIGDTLQVQITATWGTVGNGFRPMALIGATKQLVVASDMRKEGD